MLGLSEFTKNNRQFKRVLNPCFKGAGMIHRIF